MSGQDPSTTAAAQPVRQTSANQYDQYLRQFPGYLQGYPGMRGGFMGRQLQNVIAPEGAMTQQQLRALQSYFQPELLKYLNEQQNNQQTTPPTTQPQPSEELLGLIKQTADPYGTYGQLGVANPYMEAINQRFGYDPNGLAYGVDLQRSPSFYQPPTIYPDVYQPKFTAQGMYNAMLPYAQTGIM